MGRLANIMAKQSQPGLKAFAKGGKVHSDAAEDKKLIVQTLKDKKLLKKGGCCK